MLVMIPPFPFIVLDLGTGKITSMKDFGNVITGII
jgi:hypothetical protein